MAFRWRADDSTMLYAGVYTYVHLYIHLYITGKTKVLGQNFFVS